MSRVMLALGSFIVGASMTFFMVSGSHTSTLAQGPNAVAAPALVPVVPPIGRLNFSGTTWSSITQQLDGVTCNGCVFDNVTFTYGGGAWSFQNVTISHNFRITFSGAAANTVMLLNTLGMLPSGKAPKQAAPNIPIQRAAETKDTVTLTLESPFK